MLLGIGYGLGELLRPFDYSRDIYHKEYEDLKRQNKKVDLVLIGASRMLVAFDPEIFEKKLQLDKAYNLSISQQNLEGVYYQLKGFITEFHPKYVVIGIAEGSLTYKITPKITKLRLLERLHGTNRLDYIRNSFSLNDYPYLINVFSYRNNLSGIRVNMRNKQQFQNEGVFMKTAKWQSKGNGFIAYNMRVPQGNIGLVPTNKFEPSQISDKTKYYLDKCVQLCKENGVRLFFVSPPTSLSNIYSISNFQDVVNYVTAYAKENNVPYCNMNYLKDRESYFPDSMMYDFKHINKYGAPIVSEKYADVLAKELQGIDSSDLFYGSVDELKRTVDRIVAVGAKPVIKNNVMTLPVQSFQNRNVTPYYQVLLATKKNEFKTIVDWTNKKTISFKIPKGSRFRVLLRARHKENAGSYAWMAWEFDAKGKFKKVNDVPESFYKVN